MFRLCILPVLSFVEHRRIPVVLVSGVSSNLNRISHPSESRHWSEPLEDRLQPWHNMPQTFVGSGRIHIMAHNRGASVFTLLKNHD